VVAIRVNKRAKKPAVAKKSAQPRAFVATRKGLFTFRRSGLGWKTAAPAFLGEPVSAVLPDARTGRLFAALNLGHFGAKLHRSDDGGATWQEMAVPAFPPTAAKYKARNDTGEPKAPALDMIWTLVAGGADEPEVIWAGTTPGGLFRSADGGQSWTLISSLWELPERAGWMGGGYDHPGINTLLVDPRDSRRLTLGVSTGGVWRSDDGAQTWSLVGQGLRNEYMPPGQEYDRKMQDVHRMASPKVDPNVVWLQHHNGIFRSTDGGLTFKEIKKVSPSVFGFAVAAHPLDSKTAWFVPAVRDMYRVPVEGRLVVTRTRDGGKSFETLGTGLPRKNCYDLIYRHGLDVDGAGEHLVMGSTTGNLWIGNGGGRTWSHVSAHLPPIAAVAWG
jgi:hypothetical protein